MLKIHNPDNKPLYIMLVGCPGSGKTTFRKNFIKENPNFTIISSDDYIERKCKELNISYSFLWNKMEYNDWTELHQELKRRTLEALYERNNIIVDLTNITKHRRWKNAQYIPDFYHKVAIVFNISLDKMIKRDKTRDISREIPENSLIDIFNSFEYPDEEWLDGIIDYS